MAAQTRITPVNQAVRVNILRVAFLLCLPLILFTRSAWQEGIAFETVEILGRAFVITAVLGRFWSILYIGGRKNNTVMQDGPYSICRHPLYLFSTIGALGFGLMLGSFVLMVVLGGLTYVILAITAKKEEAFLRGTFGSDYESYSRRVPMILPKPSLFATAPTLTISVSHLRQNLMDALVFLFMIPFAELMEILKDSGVLSTIPLR